MVELDEVPLKLDELDLQFPKPLLVMLDIAGGQHRITLLRSLFVAGHDNSFRSGIRACRLLQRTSQEAANHPPQEFLNS